MPRKGWVRSQTPPRLINPATRPCVLCTLADERPPGTVLCSYCQKAYEYQAFIEKHSDHRVEPWQLRWLSRWLRHQDIDPGAPVRVL